MMVFGGKLTNEEKGGFGLRSYGAMLVYLKNYQILSEGYELGEVEAEGMKNLKI